MVKAIFKKIWFIVFISLFSQSAFAQAKGTPEELFERARILAFEHKNYVEAISLSKKALVINPDYADIRIFLGRLYSWTNKPDSARTEFKRVIEQNKEYVDTYLAYGSLEYWNKEFETALEIVSTGLQYNQKAEDLLLLKVKILNSLGRFDEANKTLNNLLKINPTLIEARALSGQSGTIGANNKIGLGYTYVYFDKQFNDPWHMANLEYSHQTKAGSLTGRINLANRFKTGGTQYEVDFYPHISRTFYAYVNGAYSSNTVVFPEYRAGFSLYANLPSAFEAEGGFRLLSNGTQTWIYTAALGKYYKNFWFNLRSYITPSNSSVGQSGSLNIRYYFGGADDYFAIGAGKGISPDNPRNNLLYNSGNPYRLKSSNLSIGYRRTIGSSHIIQLKASLENQEYLKETKGNQFEFGAAYLIRF